MNDRFAPLLAVSLRAVRELVETLKAVGLQLLHAPRPVVVGVVVGDERHAHHHLLGGEVARKVFQIPQEPGDRLAGVLLVNVGMQVFDVHDQGIHMRQHRLQVFFRHVEGGFKGELPVGTAQLAEADDKIRAQQRLAAAGAHAAAGGQKVQLVDAYLLVKLLRCQTAQPLRRTQTGGVQTVAAVQRTAVEGRQSGHPVAINADAMPYNTDEWSRLQHVL